MGATRRAVSGALCLLVLLGLGAVPASGSPGERLWVRRYDNGDPSNDSDLVSDVGVSPDGSKVFVTGRSFRSDVPDYATVAYDASTGRRLWVKRYNGTGNYFDEPYALGVSPDGSKVFVTGDSVGPSTTDYATVAYDASTGTQLWVKRYRRAFARALGVSPDGSKVFVTGSSYQSWPDFATVAYDASTGARLWVTRYRGGSADALGVSPDGSKVFVTGTRSSDFATVAYDASTGTQLWEKRYNGTRNGYDFADSLGVSPDGARVYVTGASLGLTSGDYPYDYATVAYDASTGAELWVNRYNGPGDKLDKAQALGVSPDGSKVFVTGSSGYDWATLAYDASTGAPLWARRYNGPGKSYYGARALGVSPDGSYVFVTGESIGPTGSSDYATGAYDAATGAELWLRWYDGYASSWDSPEDLAVSPEGSRLFVTGRSVGSTRWSDYATVAYSVT